MISISHNENVRVKNHTKTRVWEDSDSTLTPEISTINSVQEFHLSSRSQGLWLLYIFKVKLLSFFLNSKWVTFGGGGGHSSHVSRAEEYLFGGRVLALNCAATDLFGWCRTRDNEHVTYIIQSQLAFGEGDRGCAAPCDTYLPKGKELRKPSV
jgi:hypothetical protein